MKRERERELWHGILFEEPNPEREPPTRPNWALEDDDTDDTGLFKRETTHIWRCDRLRILPAASGAIAAGSRTDMFQFQFVYSQPIRMEAVREQDPI